MMIKILVLNDDLNSFSEIKHGFKMNQAQAICVSDPWQALTLCSEQIFDLIIINMKYQGDGFTIRPDVTRETFYLLKKSLAYLPKVVLVVSDFPDNYEPLIFEGVVQIIQRPVKIDIVVSVAMEIVDSSVLFDYFTGCHVA